MYVVAYPLLLGVMNAIGCRSGFKCFVGRGNCVDEVGQQRPGVIGDTGSLPAPAIAAAAELPVFCRCED